MSTALKLLEALLHIPHIIPFAVPLWTNCCMFVILNTEIQYIRKYTAWFVLKLTTLIQCLNLVYRLYQCLSVLLSMSIFFFPRLDNKDHFFILNFSEFFFINILFKKNAIKSISSC